MSGAPLGKVICPGELHCTTHLCIVPLMTQTATAPHAHVTAGIAALTELATLNRLGRERRNCTECFAAIVAELETRHEARQAEANAAMPFVIRITRNGATQVSYASSRAAALDGTMWARAEGAEVEILAR